MWDTAMIQRVERYLSLEDPALHTDHILIEECIDRAEAHLEEWCSRYFKARKETRVYDCPDSDTLLLDADLVKAIRVTNGDGTVLSPYDFRYLPANSVPKYAIVLVSSSSVAWTYNDTPQQCIKVRGYWGYSLEPDPYTIQTALRLATFLYKQKDSQVFDTSSFLDGGVLVLPDGVPKYVQEFVARRGRINIGVA